MNFVPNGDSMNLNMNGFTRKKVESLTLGEKLRKIRSERRINLNEVSKITKIQVKYLEYLENGEYDKLPPQVYVKGFLRSYAVYLGISEKGLIRAYERERGIQSNIRKDTEMDSERTPIRVSSFALTPKILTISIVSFLIIGGVLYLYNELDSFVSVPRLIVISPSNESVIEGSQVYFRGVVDKGSEVFVNDQPILVNEEGEFSENVSLQEGLNVVKIKAINRFKKESEKVISVSANYQKIETINDEEGEQDESNDNKEKGIEMEVYVSPDPTWISVEADENLIYSGVLLPQVTQIFRADEQISITSGRGDGTFIKVNGKEIGSLGDNPGVARDITFTKDTEY